MCRLTDVLADIMNIMVVPVMSHNKPRPKTITIQSCSDFLNFSVQMAIVYSTSALMINRTAKGIIPLDNNGFKLYKFVV